MVVVDGDVSSWNANMKVSEQCRIAASKSNQVLGMICRNITYKEKSLIVTLYKATVRPHLEYCTQVLSPYLRKDIDMLEQNTEENIIIILVDAVPRQKRNFKHEKQLSQQYRHIATLACTTKPAHRQSTVRTINGQKR